MLNPSPERERGREGGRERGKEEGRGGKREREGERGRGGGEREREVLGTYTHMQTCTHASSCAHTMHMYTYCVPIIMYCIPTLREISVTTRADKVFLMPAQVLGSDTWLQREWVEYHSEHQLEHQKQLVRTTNDVTPSS